MNAARYILPAISAIIAMPATAQYTVDTAIQGSVLGQTRKIDGKGPARMTAKQREFWRGYCAKWPKGGSCDRYRREIARRR